MKFPNYPTENYPSPTPTLIEAYIDFCGRYELDNEEKVNHYDDTSLRHISKSIGQGCLFLINDDPLVARHYFAHARYELTPNLIPNQRILAVGRNAIQLDKIATLLINRNNKAAISETRQSIHHETVQSIKQIRLGIHREELFPQSRTDAPGALRGELAQHVTQALFTRYVHPWIMAVPALVHQDESKIGNKANNFDLLLVESMPNQPTTAKTNYKLQIKASCAGLCSRKRSGPITGPQRRYRSDIIIVSACCDLLRGDQRDTSFRQFEAAELLTKEHEGTATDLEIGELDSYTNSLLLSVTMGDERRMGKIPVLARRP